MCGDSLDLEDYGQASLRGGAAPTVDHLWPQAFGGDDDPDNLMLACGGCNSSKGLSPPWVARMQHRGVPWPPLSPPARVLATAAGGIVGGALGGRLAATRDDEGRLRPSKDGAVLGAVIGAAITLLLT